MAAEAREDPFHLSTTFTPLSDDERIPMGNVFTSCNWVMRDGCDQIRNIVL
jgi:ATP-dependent DNA helicase 2 subunit 1